MKNFIESFYSEGLKCPDKILFTISASNFVKDLSYRNLLEGSRKYACMLRINGASLGDVVLISLKLDEELIFAFLGALYIGCVPSIMPFPSIKQDPVLFWEGHNKLFKHIGAPFIITFSQNVEAIRKNINASSLIVLTPDTAFYTDLELKAHDWVFEDVCVLQHSSGTTGLKKGVALTVDAIQKQIKSYSMALNLENNDVLVSWLPLYHDMGFVATLLLPLATGNRSVLMSPFEWLSNPLELFRLIEKYNGAYTWLPNFAFLHLARSVRDGDFYNLSNVKAFINCSEPCKPEAFEIFEQTFKAYGVSSKQLQVSYAMAETVFAVTQTKIGTPVSVLDVSQDELRVNGRILTSGKAMVSILSVGEPIAGIEIKIFGGNDVGEIGVKGDFVFTSYFKQDSATYFKDGFYLTGDLGFVYNKSLYVLGRTKDSIIILGKNFFAHEIEAILSSIEGIKPGRLVAIGVYNASIGSEDLVVISEYLDGFNNNKIKSDIKNLLENTFGLTPKKILFVNSNWLIKSTSGKVSRKANIDKFVKEFSNGV